MSLKTAAAVATVLGIGMLVLQRWVAQTLTVAIVLVVLWFVAVAAGVVLAARRDRRLLRPGLATVAVIALATVAVGYWTGFRDHRVNEDVVVAERIASDTERQAGLAPAPAAPVARGLQEKGKEVDAASRPPAGPVRLLAGTIAGADGHSATGRASVVRKADGTRLLTLTDFDASTGPQVVVKLSPNDGETDNVIELGGLKGNIGDQQYRIPDSADLSRYDTLILWCVPFTTRIATAALS